MRGKTLHSYQLTVAAVWLIAIGTHVKWKKWMVPLGANRFDDRYGNTGTDKDVEVGKFVVVPATLQVRTG
jgi:hypothetical protein